MYIHIYIIRTQNNGPRAQPVGSGQLRESIRGQRESTGVDLGDIPKKGVVRCSLDSCLLLSLFFA